MITIICVLLSWLLVFSIMGILEVLGYFDNLSKKEAVLMTILVFLTCPPLFFVCLFYAIKERRKKRYGCK